MRPALGGGNPELIALTSVKLEGTVNATMLSLSVFPSFRESSQKSIAFPAIACAEKAVSLFVSCRKCGSMNTLCHSLTQSVRARQSTDGSHVSATFEALPSLLALSLVLRPTANVAIRVHF